MRLLSKMCTPLNFGHPWGGPKLNGEISSSQKQNTKKIFGKGGPKFKGRIVQGVPKLKGPKIKGGRN